MLRRYKMEVKRLLSKCLLFNFKVFLFNPFEVPPASNFEKNIILPAYSLFVTLFVSLGTVSILMVGIMDSDESISAISFGAGALVCLASYYFFLLHKTKIGRLLINVESNMFKYRFEEHDGHISYAGLCREEQIKRLTVFLNVMGYGNVFAACVISVVSRIVWNDVKSLAFPFWVPWSTENLVGYIIVEIIQMSYACCVCALSLGNTIYVVLIYLEYKRQYERLRMAINKIPERAATEIYSQQPMKKTAVDKKPDVYHEKFASYLTECVDHHRTLKMNFEYFRPYFESFFTTELCECILILCLSLHALLEALEHGTAPVTFALLGHLLLSLFLKCYVGEKFSELNDTVTDALYDLPWYDGQTISNRKLLHIFQMQTQRPYVLKGLQLFPASLFVFAKIIKTTYSLLNLIRAS